MTDREARKAFVKFCREQKESWLVCTVDREQLFWIWQAAALAERERWQNKDIGHNTQTYEPAPYYLNPNFKMPVSS